MDYEEEVSKLMTKIPMPFEDFEDFDANVPIQGSNYNNMIHQIPVKLPSGQSIILKDIMVS